MENLKREFIENFERRNEGLEFVLNCMNIADQLKEYPDNATLTTIYKDLKKQERAKK